MQYDFITRLTLHIFNDWKIIAALGVGAAAITTGILALGRHKTSALALIIGGPFLSVWIISFNLIVPKLRTDFQKMIDDTSVVDDPFGAQ